MIKASFTYQKELGIVSMLIEGHSGQAEKGNDLICAASSMLAYTVAQYVDYVDKADGLTEKPFIEIEDGYMSIVTKPTEKYIAEVLNAFFVAEVGYSLLAQDYPQYVELKLFGEAKKP